MRFLSPAGLRRIDFFSLCCNNSLSLESHIKYNHIIWINHENYINITLNKPQIAFNDIQPQLSESVKGEMNQSLDIFSSAILKRQNV